MSIQKWLSSLVNKRAPVVIIGFIWWISCVWIFLIHQYYIVPSLQSHNFTNLQSIFWLNISFCTLLSLLIFVLHFRIHTRLLQSQQDYKKLFDQNPNPMWVFASDTYQFIRVNQAAITHYGYTREEFLQMTIRDIRPQDDLEKLNQLASQKKELGYQSMGVWRHRKKNGEIIWVDISVTRLLFENKMVGMVMAKDITESFNAQKAVEAYKNKLENVLDSITDAFFTLNHQLEFTYINRAYASFLSQPIDNYLGTKIDQVLPYILGNGFLDYCQKALTSQKSCHFESYSSLNQHFLKTSIYPTAEGLAIYSQDLTAFKQATDKLTHQDQKIRDIIFTQVHILRRPVANALGLINLIKQESIKNKALKEYFKLLEYSFIQLDEIIHEIVHKAEQE